MFTHLIKYGILKRNGLDALVINGNGNYFFTEMESKN